MSSKLVPEVLEYLELVESGVRPVCPEQVALAALVRRIFETEDVTTVTVKATLIVSASADEETVYNLTKAIFDNIDAIAAENGKGAELSIENATTGMTAPFHAGAAKYFAEKGATVNVG